MANWAMTIYRIVGEKESVAKIYDAVANHPVKEGSSENWEGNVLSALGVSDEKIEKASLRGFVAEHELLDRDGKSVISLQCDEAWARTDFAELLQEVYPDVKIFWIVEEFGCGVFETNDEFGEFFPERFWIDVCVNGEYDSAYLEKKEDVFEFLQEYELPIHTDKDIEEWDNSRQNDDYIYLIECNVV